MPTKDRKAGLDVVRIGEDRKVYGYKPEVALKILERIAEGHTLSAICKENGMPTRQTVHRWIVMHPELTRAYTAARELSALAFEEEALGMAFLLEHQNDFTGTKVRAFEVAMQQFRWSAARRDPRRYGQQTGQTIVVPIQINTTLDMGAGEVGGRSTPEHPDIFHIEAKVTPEFPDPLEPPAKVTYEVVEHRGAHGAKKGRRQYHGKRPDPAFVDTDMEMEDTA